MASRRGNFDIPVSHRGPSSQSSYGAGQPMVQSKFLDKLHDYANVADHKLSEIGEPLNPYLPLIGRVLVVSTFVEDTWRILTNWSTQVEYMWLSRGFPWILVELFFILNVIFMAVGSALVVAKKQLLFGVCSLLGVLFSQAVAYGHYDLTFFSRMFSLVGGLLLVVSEVFAQEKRRMPSLPEMDSKDRSQSVILAGRILIVVLFVSHLLRTKWTFTAILINLVSTVSCVLLVVGYKTRFSASVLAIMLLIQNFVTANYWRFNSRNPQRDMLRFEYFQVLSIVGGLIMLVKLGAGRLSFDEKRKIY